MTVWINRRTGVMHRNRSCLGSSRFIRDWFDRSASTRTGLDVAVPGAGCPSIPSTGFAVTSPSRRRSAFAGRRPPVTERSEGKPRSGLTGGQRSAPLRRSGDGEVQLPPRSRSSSCGS